VTAFEEVQKLARALRMTGRPLNHGADHLTMVIGTQTWLVVHCPQAEDERVWDVFRESEGPHYGEYTRQVAPVLMTADQVVDQFKGPRENEP
jgi:hypothetical protein